MKTVKHFSRYELVSFFHPVHIHSLSCVTVAATCSQWRVSRVAVKSKCCTSLLHFSSHIYLPTFFVPPLPPILNMEELICSFRSQHLILFIFPLVFFPHSYLSHPQPFSFRQGCAVRPFQSTGVVRSDGWLSTFCCLPLRSWEIYRLADYQAWKPISLSHSSHPSSIHAASLLPSHALIFNILSVTRKKRHSNWIDVCKTTLKFVCGQKKAIAPLRLLWMCQKGITHSGWYVWSLTAYLSHLHLLHCFQFLKKHCYK